MSSAKAHWPDLTSMDKTGPGVYLHVPFCLSKCSYCSFYSCTATDTGIRQYHAAVLKRLNTLRHHAPWKSLTFTTIFFGGGTPSIIPVPLLAELLARIKESFSITSDQAEISIEVNPATIDQEGLGKLRHAGFNRLSIGFQSLDDQQLKRIGRPHSANDALETYVTARKAGFSNISIDLMYGLPDQTPEQWKKILGQTMELKPEHISMYELTLEPGTPLASAVDRGEISLPDEDAVMEMMEITRETISHSPFKRYEISNYARPGFRCRHNLNYWNNGSYLGIGPGAVSAFEGKRWSTREDLAQFLDATKTPRSIEGEEEVLNHEAYFRETVVIGLRLTDGIDLKKLHDRFSIDPMTYYDKTLTHLIAQKLLKLEGWNLSLTKHGLALANTVMAELV